MITSDILTANPNLLIPLNLHRQTTQPIHEEFPVENKLLYYYLLIYHPKSEIYNLPEAEKIKIIKTYEDIDLESPLGKSIKEFVLEILLTPSERALLTLEKKLLELAIFIEKTEYSLDNVKILNDAQIAMDKLTETIKSIKEKLATEEEINNSSFLEDFHTS